MTSEDINIRSNPVNDHADWCDIEEFVNRSSKDTSQDLTMDISSHSPLFILDEQAKDEVKENVTE